MYVLRKIVRGHPGFDRSLGSETHAVIPTVYVCTCLVVGSWSAVPHMQSQAATPEYSRAIGTSGPNRVEGSRNGIWNGGASLQA
jgi:hypothetical protein